jgi:hypothetical protein
VEICGRAIGPTRCWCGAPHHPRIDTREDETEAVDRPPCRSVELADDGRRELGAVVARAQNEERFRDLNWGTPGERDRRAAPAQAVVFVAEQLESLAADLAGR